MRHRVELPSLPVIGFVALVVAAVVFIATRPHDDRERQPLIDAVNATFAHGGEVTATDYKSSASIGESTTSSEYTISPGTNPWSLGDERAVIGAVDIAVGVKSAGSETIDGVATSHYTAVVDDDKSKAPEMTALKARPSRIDIWIDAGGLIRRYKLEDWIAGANNEPLDSYITLDFRY